MGAEMCSMVFSDACRTCYMAACNQTRLNHAGCPFPLLSAYPTLSVCPQRTATLGKLAVAPGAKPSQPASSQIRTLRTTAVVLARLSRGWTNSAL